MRRLEELEQNELEDLAVEIEAMALDDDMEADAIAVELWPFHAELNGEDETEEERFIKSVLSGIERQVKVLDVDYSSGLIYCEDEWGKQHVATWTGMFEPDLSEEYMIEFRGHSMHSESSWGLEDKRPVKFHGSRLRLVA